MVCRSKWIGATVKAKTFKRPTARCQQHSMSLVGTFISTCANGARHVTIDACYLTNSLLCHIFFPSHLKRKTLGSGETKLPRAGGWVEITPESGRPQNQLYAKFLALCFAFAARSMKRCLRPVLTMPQPDCKFCGRSGAVFGSTFWLERHGYA